jgi:hypothetical protein
MSVTEQTARTREDRMANGYDTTTQGPRSVSESLEIKGRRTDPTAEEIAEWRRAQSRSVVEARSGRRIEVESDRDGRDHVTVRGVEGQVELEVTLTERGPVLRFRAAEMQLEAAGRLSVQCEELDVQATRGIRHETQGDLEQLVGGDAATVVSGELRSQARSTEIRSMRGDVRIRANDDVRLNGERVKLNC